MTGCGGPVVGIHVSGAGRLMLAIWPIATPDAILKLPSDMQPGGVDNATSEHRCGSVTDRRSKSMSRTARVVASLGAGTAAVVALGVAGVLPASGDSNATTASAATSPSTALLSSKTAS